LPGVAGLSLLSSSVSPLRRLTAEATPACSLQNLRFWRRPGQAQFQFLIKLKQLLSGIGITTFSLQSPENPLLSKTRRGSPTPGGDPVFFTGDPPAATARAKTFPFTIKENIDSHFQKFYL
jgi:hypothetical protein